MEKGQGSMEIKLLSKMFIVLLKLLWNQLRVDPLGILGGDGPTIIIPPPHYFQSGEIEDPHLSILFQLPAA